MARQIKTTGRHIADSARGRLVKLSATLPIGLLVLTLGGCAGPDAMLSFGEVKPWERGVLAGDSMQFVDDAMNSSVDDHMYFSREASTGGRGVQGGGCGCN